ncbi:fatty acyl-CoA reductase 1-like isoform X2 [Neltuma alba]|nr:fatty acyl-CoA reductase 1-like isoform X2 [Prosopis alba]
MHDEIIRKELFRVLREKWGADFESLMAEKVVAVAGDVSVANLGIKNANLEKMWEEIDVIANFAANTNFDERYDIAMEINTMGALHVLNFAKSCRRIQVFLHLSTAYICGEPREGELIKEEPLRMGQTLNDASKVLDIYAEKTLIQKTIEQLRSQYTDNDMAITSAMKDFGIKRANLYGWPNTYVFTKAMGEMLVSNFKNEIPLVIIRPTMVTSTYKEPFPGWVEGVRTLDAVIGGYGKGKVECFLGDPQTILDVIPADMVINCMLSAMAIQSSHKYIYHVSSSLRNSLTISCVRHLSYLYFKNKPLTDYKSGKPIIISKALFLSTMAGFHAHMTTRYVLPLKVLYAVNQVFCQIFRDVYNRNDRKVKTVIRMAQLYKPYVFFKALFDDRHTEELRERSSKILKDVGFDLGFDPNSIDWRDYLLNVHFPGLVNYAINSSPRLPKY